MDEVHEKIRRSSTAAFVFLAILAGVLLAVSIFGAIALAADGAHVDPTVDGGLRPYTVAGMQALLGALLVYVAFIFRRIAKEETPFFPGLSRKVKLAAPLLFLAFALPRWIAYAVISVSSGTLTGTLLDEVNIILLAAAVIVFCLGHILEYGWRLQDESNGIV